MSEIQKELLISGEHLSYWLTEGDVLIQTLPWLCHVADVKQLNRSDEYIFDHLPTTIVSSGISSIKHFFSVSPMWKYRPKAEDKQVNTRKTCCSDMLDILTGN